MEIKVTISLDERTHKVLNKLIDTIALNINANRSFVPGQPDQDNGEWTEEEMRDVMAETAEEDAEMHENDDSTEAEEVTAPKAKKANRPVSDDVDAPNKVKPKVTLEDLRALAADVKKKTGSIKKVKALLNAYSAENISALSADKWDEFAEKLKGLL